MSRSRFTEDKTVLSQFTKNKIGISHFTVKRGYRHTLRNYVQSKALLVVFTIRPLRVLGAAKGNRVPRSAYHEIHHLPPLEIYQSRYRMSRHRIRRADHLRGPLM